MANDPTTREEWQSAVDAAEGAIHLESARMYGWVAGGPQVNVDRCEEILRKGAKRGITPRPGAVEEFVRQLQIADG
ncbi:MAG: hypothetical protein ABII12_03290 [Planctomycetota bacterium]